MSSYFIIQTIDVFSITIRTTEGVCVKAIEIHVEEKEEDKEEEKEVERETEKEVQRGVEG